MITPFGTNILVKPTEQVTVLTTGPSLCEYGEVLAVGDKVQNVKVGQKIGFVIWGINSLEIEGVKHYFVNESSDFILGIIDDISQQ
jgi:co-chaperonin GroES (HSP10)